MTELDIEMDPITTIQYSIYDLIGKSIAWEDRADPDGVKPALEARIEKLYQAQRELSEFRDLKKSLRKVQDILA